MKKYSIILVSLLFMVSCELDREPYNSLTDGLFWKTESDLATACNSLYPSLQGHTNRDVYSDICYGASPDNISSGTYTPTNSFGPWNKAYERIADCNKIIEQVTLITEGLAEQIKNRYIAEAKFFRAYHYYDLLRSYGGVPIVDTVLDLDSEILYGPRNTRDEVVSFILGDLEFAESWLPNEDQLTGAEEGRITRTAALTLTSRIALYEGTRQKFKEGGDYVDLLEKAKDAALLVINSGQHELYEHTSNSEFDNYRFAFLYEGENSKESILANRYIMDWRKHNRSFQLLRTSACLPTRKVVDSYLSEDGLPIEHSPLFEGYTTGDSEFYHRDPRMRASIFMPHEDDWWKHGEKYTPDFGMNGTTTGYHWKKTAILEEAITMEGHVDFMVIRYAEALLNYAEASFEINESISDDDLDISINVLRDRVGMVHISNSFINGNNPANVTLSMRDEIRRERLVELAVEGFRYDDLLRWGIAHEVLPQAIKGLKNYGDEYPLIPWDEYEQDENGFLIIQEASTRFFEEKNYLWPIPLMQISLNDQLEQNPGW